MPLALMRIFEAPQEAPDFYLMSGELCVGRIYKRATEARIAISLGTCSAGPTKPRIAGMAAMFNQAQAALQDNWERWLAWAKLQEAAGLLPSLPANRRNLPDPESGLAQSLPSFGQCVVPTLASDAKSQCGSEWQ
jgi:hypothetical protein